MTTKRAPLEGGNTTDMQSIQEALNHINPVDLNYDTWVRVGMALRSAGCTCGTWETWSSQDPERFHDGECEKKWDSFNSDGVGIATLFYLAKQGGWSPRDNCNDTRNLPDCSEFIRAISAQPKTPEEQLSTYLSSAFEPADQIRVVGNAYVDENGRLCFTKGTTRPRNDWMKILKNGGVDAVGPFNEFGGWCAVNPLDGKGVKAGNVTRFKHTLIECDEIPVDEQERLIRELKLPVTTLVHSGGKSIHALVRVDASNRQEYDERVKRLHEICKDARFNVDPACKDPGRLTRLPGVLRDCVLQRLLDTYIGCESWDSWIRHLEAPGVKFIPTKIAGSGPMPPPLFKNGPIPGALGLFIGEDGIGKGYVILDLLVSCVLGRPVNLQTICSQGKPMRVLYLCYEDMCPVLEWRLVRICEEAEISPELWRDAERQGLLTVKALPRQPEEE
ncbi:MAG TPA: PriCT-2 domain-containing protein, partial [Candidatus Hydrogenedentes bacterium]|nr:PriCT-2 domain-containing protein [Candidatus Hydrogenedentota bacterium]